MRPHNLDVAYPRNVLGVRYWGVVDGTPSVKYVGAVDPPNI